VAVLFGIEALQEEHVEPLLRALSSIAPDELPDILAGCAVAGLGLARSGFEPLHAL
jgi:hypothetical protein